MASIGPKDTGVVYTDGIVETRAAANGVLSRAISANNPQWTPSKVGKDFQDVQRVNYTDIAGANETNVDKVVPEAGVYAGAAAASLTTSLTGANNDLVFTAKTVGPVGNGITVTYVDPGGATATLGVVTTNRDIVVNLGRAASAINTTGTLLAAAIAADPAANALVSVANSGADDGSGLVTAMSKTNLSGGSLGTLVS